MSVAVHTVYAWNETIVWTFEAQKVVMTIHESCPGAYLGCRVWLTAKSPDPVFYAVPVDAMDATDRFTCCEKRVGNQSYNSRRYFSNQYRREKNFSYSDEICTHRSSSPFFFSFFHLSWLGTQHTFWTAKKNHSIPSVCPIFSTRPPENPALCGYMVNEGYIQKKQNNE